MNQRNIEQYIKERDIPKIQEYFRLYGNNIPLDPFPIDDSLNEKDIPYLTLLGTSKQSSEIAYYCLNTTSTHSIIFNNIQLLDYFHQNYPQLTMQATDLSFFKFNNQETVTKAFSINPINFKNPRELAKFNKSSTKICDEFFLFLVDKKLFNFSHNEIENIYFFNYYNYSTKALNFIHHEYLHISRYDFQNLIEKLTILSWGKKDISLSLIIDNDSFPNTLKNHRLNKDSLNTLLDWFTKELFSSTRELSVLHSKFQNVLSYLNSKNPKLFHYLLQTNFYTEPNTDTQQYVNMITYLKLEKEVIQGYEQKNRVKI